MLRTSERGVGPPCLRKPTQTDIFQDAKLNEVLELLELYNIGAVPVVNDQGRVIDMYRYVLII